MGRTESLKVKIFADGAELDGIAKVEHDRVIVFGRAEEVSVLAINREIHGIAVLLQRGLELFAESRFVLDDQDAHGLVSPLSCR